MEIGCLLLGGFFMAVADFGLKFYMRSKKRQYLSDAEKKLKDHGLEARLYLPAIGINNKQLFEALERCAMSGRVIIDKNNQIIGGIDPGPEKRKPDLRLVVSND